MTRELLSRLDNDHPKIVDRLRDWAGTISGGNGGPTAKGTVSDPTGNAAMAVDEWGQTRTRMDQLIRTMATAAADLEFIRRQVMDTDTTDPDKPNQRAATLQPCANQNGCPDDAWACRAGRCDTCYAYRHRTGRDRRIAGQPRGPRKTGNTETADR